MNINKQCVTLNKKDAKWYLNNKYNSCYGEDKEFYKFLSPLISKTIYNNFGNTLTFYATTSTINAVKEYQMKPKEVVDNEFTLPTEYLLSYKS